MNVHARNIDIFSRTNRKLRTLIKMYKPYGPCVHFGYYTLISDPSSKKYKNVVSKMQSHSRKVPKQAGAKRNGVINSRNYIFNQCLTQIS